MTREECRRVRQFAAECELGELQSLHKSTLSHAHPDMNHLVCEFEGQRV
jgi:hypothetical protein